MNTNLYIFAGHYGSGKTEVAVNYAFYLKEKMPGEKIAIVDLDIVNPFFRTADCVKALEEEGIRVQLPLFANTNVDIAALTPEIGYLIEEKAYHVVLDVGGDDLGAKALGRYCEEIVKRGYIMYFVINTNRPYTNTVESASKMFDEIEKTSGLKITGIVNNTNLLQETDKDVLIEGMKVIKALSIEKNVPVLMWSAMENVAKELEGETEGADILPLKEYIKLLWGRNSQNR